VTRATMAPRSLPTPSVRSMRTSFDAPRLKALDDTGAAAWGFRRRRQLWHDVEKLAAQRDRRRDAGGGKCIERLQHIGLGCKRPRGGKLRFIGIVMANGNVEQGRRRPHSATAYRPSPLHRRSSHPAARARRVRSCWRASSWEMRSLRAVRSDEPAASRGVDFRVVQRARSLVGLRAQIGDVAAQRAGRFLQRIEPRDNRRIGGGACRPWLRPRQTRTVQVRRPQRLSLAARAGGACTAGQPSTQPTPITTAAATGAGKWRNDPGRNGCGRNGGLRLGTLRLSLYFPRT